MQLSAANAHDSTYLERTVDAIPPIFGPRGKPGRPRFRPDKLHADKGYDYPEKRRALRRRGIALRSGSILVDRATGQTSNAKYYAGGDCVNGGREVVDAVADGKRSALAISAALTEAAHG